MARDLLTLVAAPLVTVVLPLVLIFCTLALLLGGSGIRRVVLVFAGLGSLATLWLIAATKYVVGVGKGGVGTVLGPLLGWLINDVVKSWNNSPLGKQARITLPRASNIEFAILVAPFLLAVLLGAYALITIGIKLFRFNDCEEASVELSKVSPCCCLFRHSRLGAGGTPVGAPPLTFPPLWLISLLLFQCHPCSPTPTTPRHFV